ncbi:putative serine protease HhoB precursor [Anaerotignum neopropionicum]|uniref:Putative serine protease HhoB n=1 Tax=Anaerotignum neopropionicum TaxID=36847 RepID=A0A136WGD5_9FIRM|nr:stalk domain-containing protein [Anaerotignum neopropionicum]KXL53527.1 putative serine protease HhoB precursor [Anaerotignum neopropionicum]
MRKISRGFILFLILCFSAIMPATAKNISVTLNGYPLPLSAPALIENDRVLVPMRSIMEALNYTVVWHQDSRTVEATKDDTQLFLTINNPIALVNQESVTLDAAATLSDNTTMVPLRFVAEYSGATVEWNGETYTVIITTRQISQGDLTDSVVYLQTNKMQGSGIILSSDGLIATNFHVIEGASLVQMVFADNSIYQGNATVVGLDAQRDIALLQIDKENLIPATVAASIVKGDAVTTVGAPKGNRNTVSQGFINDFNQDIISASAFIDHGSSGGALFNSSGKLIGMTSSYSDEESFAIPVSEIMKVPKNLSIPIRQMKSYSYTPSAPQNLDYRLENNSAYVTWAPVYDADYFYVYISYTKGGTFAKLQNKALGGDTWYWGFPQCFGISTINNRAVYIKVSAVRNGIETPTTDALEIQFN